MNFGDMPEPTKPTCPTCIYSDTHMEWLICRYYPSWVQKSFNEWCSFHQNFKSYIKQFKIWETNERDRIAFEKYGEK